MDRETKRIKWLPEIEMRIQQVRNDLIQAHKPCDGTGYLSVGLRQRQPCKCMIHFTYLIELIKANISQDYWNLDFEKLEIDSLVRKVVRVYLKNIKYVKQQGLGLVFFGPNGTGKTSVMAEIGKEAIINQMKVKYFTLSSYIDAVFSKDNNRVAYYEDGSFLLIDELDKKIGNSNIYKMVDEFARRMFTQNKCLILGTNWDIDELKEHLGESTYSLMKRRCEFLDFKGKDYSDTVQDSFIKKITGHYNYFHESITNKAWTFNENNGRFAIKTE